jgi:SAM-dependent methyltransferase
MTDYQLPGSDLPVERMPGHWLLARLGKRVLRPGGAELTRKMLNALDIGPSDVVVELAPGLGATARLTLERGPREYIGIDRDADAARIVTSIPSRVPRRCETGSADRTGLPDASADVLYGEAMLTMQTASGKSKIVDEAFRVLAPGGRYAIHELSLVPDDIDSETRGRIATDISGAIRVGARPLTRTEWRTLLEDRGFEVLEQVEAPMLLLEPARMLQDEGLGGAARIAWNIVTTPAARRRVFEMRRVFRTHRCFIGAIALVARKPLAAHSAP